MGTIFSSGLKEKDWKEELLIIPKNIEGKNEEQLKTIKDQENKQLNAIKNINTDSKSLKAISLLSGLDPGAKELMNEIKEEENDIYPEKLVCTKSDRKMFNFNTFKHSLKLASSIYDGKIILEEANKDQYEMLKQLKDLEKFNSKNPDKINSRKKSIN